MKTKARYVGFKEIKNKKVSFFTPPHDEPDFLWVDLEELAKVFLPDEAAARMVKHSQHFGMGIHPVVAAVKDDRC